MLRRLAGRLPGYAQLIGTMDATSTASIDAIGLAAAHYPKDRAGLKVLDLGCGEGMSAPNFRQIDAEVDWHGVDIESSPEVDARSMTGEKFKTFNGVDLPYDDETFDMVYCQQVLEHVQLPHELIKEVRSVLKKGGMFVGSVSYLEPYHSYSIFNFTPYGLSYVIDKSGLSVRQMKHCTGLHYKIMRQMTGGREFFSNFSKVSLWWAFIDTLGFLFNEDRRDINILKIQYASTFSFLVVRPASPEEV